jgi:hypothetical protein
LTKKKKKEKTKRDANASAWYKRDPPKKPKQSKQGDSLIERLQKVVSARTRTREKEKKPIRRTPTERLV